MQGHYAIAKEEMEFYGLEDTSLQNLLAVLIGPKAEPTITGKLAGMGIKQLTSLSDEELLSIDGVTKLMITRLKAATGLARHMCKYQMNDNYTVRSPYDAYNYLSDLAYEDAEQFECLFLSSKNKVIARRTLFKGSLNCSIVHPREIFKEGLKLNAASIVFAHQHPSGDPTPSKEDIDVTRRCVEAGKIIGISVFDHIIIGQGGRFTSLKEKGYL